MSPRDDFTPPPEDPFLANDPEAVERERRRAQREAKRLQRSNRASLGERVSGALDGVGAKGREAIEHGRDRVVAPKKPPPDAAEPPPFRRAPAAREQGRSADPPPSASPPPRPAATPTDAPPPSRPPAPTPSRDDPASQAPASPPSRAETARPVPSSIDPAFHGETDDFAPPAPVAAAQRRPAAVESDEHGDMRRVRDEASPPASGSRSIWLRRVAALVALLVLAGGTAFAISRAGGGEEEATPAAAGPKRLKTIDVTIPEGLALADMAAIAEDAGLKGDYEKAAAKPPKAFDAKKLDVPGDVGLEGFLFPATYELEKGAPAKDLVEAQLEAFDQNFSQVGLKAAEKNLSAVGLEGTPYELVTIASMIEREVQVPEEREIVSAVIYNRLADGETLGIDATLRYEVGFDEPLTESQLAEDTPYNTRINPGLPPTPIGNPGLAALEAAADPADTNVKYYVFKPGSCGEHSFTADYDEFINLSNEYQAALEAEGGQPDDC